MCFCCCGWLCVHCKCCKRCKECSEGQCGFLCCCCKLCCTCTTNKYVAIRFVRFVLHFIVFICVVLAFLTTHSGKKSSGDFDLSKDPMAFSKDAFIKGAVKEAKAGMKSLEEGKGKVETYWSGERQQGAACLWLALETIGFFLSINALIYIKLAIGNLCPGIYCCFHNYISRKPVEWNTIYCGVLSTITFLGAILGIHILDPNLKVKSVLQHEAFYGVFLSIINSIIYFISIFLFVSPEENPEENPEAKDECERGQCPIEPPFPKIEYKADLQGNVEIKYINFEKKEDDEEFENEKPMPEKHAECSGARFASIMFKILHVVLHSLVIVSLHMDRLSKAKENVTPKPAPAGGGNSSSATSGSTGSNAKAGKRQWPSRICMWLSLETFLFFLSVNCLLITLIACMGRYRHLTKFCFLFTRKCNFFYYTIMCTFVVYGTMLGCDNGKISNKDASHFWKKGLTLAIVISLVNAISYFIAAFFPPEPGVSVSYNGRGGCKDELGIYCLDAYNTPCNLATGSEYSIGVPMHRLKSTFNLPTVQLRRHLYHLFALFTGRNRNLRVNTA